MAMFLNLITFIDTIRPGIFIRASRPPQRAVAIKNYCFCAISTHTAQSVKFAYPTPASRLICQMFAHCE